MMMDVIAVFGMLIVLMILPSLLFKSALSSKRDHDQLDPTSIPTPPNAMSVTRSEDAWSYFTAAHDFDVKQDEDGHSDKVIGC